MFSKILIANRGEIACRVIRTAREMGIETVAVYSDADADALHVRDGRRGGADRPAAGGQSLSARSTRSSPRPGRPAPRRSIRATASCPRTRDFAEALEKAGIVFIGPTAHAIAAMGDKIESKKLARQGRRHRPCPAISASIKDAEHAVEIANEIGYPVMIKASAGGGGKGMRLACTDAKSREGFRSRAARSASRASATTACSSRNSSSSRATSRSRCWATSTATSSISASANARSSAATRR